MQNILLRPLMENTSFGYLQQYLKKNVTPILANGISGSQKAHIISGLNSIFKVSSLIITNSPLNAKKLYDDLRFFMKDKVFLYPNKDIVFYSADIKSTEIIKQRFEVLNKLVKNENITVVATIEALFDRLTEKNIFKNYIIKLNVGQTLDINELIQKLIFMGYERCELVEGSGQFAIRGGIIDVFSSISQNPIRIEMWADEIESIRTIDVLSQRSFEKIDSFEIFPMRELVYGENEFNKAICNIKDEFEKSKKTYTENGHTKELSILEENINETIEKLEQEKSFSGIDKYIQFFYEKPSTLFDYLNKESIIYFDEPLRIREHSENITNEFNQSMQNRIIGGYMLPIQANMILKYDDIINIAGKFQIVLLSNINKSVKDFNIGEYLSFNVKNSVVFKNNFELLINELKEKIQKKYKILFFAGNRIRCERIVGELIDKDINAVFIEDIDALRMQNSVVYVARGSLNNGFEYPDEKFIIISDKELFGSEKIKRNKIKRENTSIIENFTDLKPGDYVVHENHGIGIFRKIEKISYDGVSKDYIKIEYADNGNLYVAINQMDLVQKYIGGDTAKPKLNKLDGIQWSKAKTKARKAAVELAVDLVKLYAQRQNAKGFVYSEDTVWQKEFEETFPYEETQDQLNAIEDVKKDMESNKIMDRLICGDVGYGKTEIAIRAAFKAVQDSKQVVYLVPTTILAQQHFNTFKMRMRNFPINVEMLSRFRTKKQQKDIIDGLSNGTIDIVIGTHRLLSKDINFRNLGMVIVDEEQRFGVSHKEKMKSLKQNVDVLTLTATPIPRTLHMSLTGIRDMSILEEPPNERLPIQTYVMEYSDEFVVDAIHREIARDGQVYFLNNRVNNISEMAAKIQKLIPEAKVGFAHGQMTERELEKVMIEFMENNINVLVCTTIVETGLDIPNVNTIIIKDADCMGLSQLYQLRGRVGRSNRTSFAYLMYKKDKMLNEVSEKRLQTIKEFTEFGSGFKIAIRDLEIRGAGNLLGAEQHGHMDSIGYDMYCKLLDEAIRKLKGEEIEEDFETLIDININAFISSEYIPNEEQKLEMYKKISSIKTQNEYYDIIDEFEDRFGKIPKPVKNLIDIAILKSVAHQLGITKIFEKNKNIILYFKNEIDINIDNLLSIIKEYKNKIMFSSSGIKYITYKPEKGEENIVLNVKEILEKLN